MILQVVVGGEVHLAPPSIAPCPQRINGAIDIFDLENMDGLGMGCVWPRKESKKVTPGRHIGSFPQIGIRMKYN